MSELFKQVKAPGIIEGNTTYFGSASEVARTLVFKDTEETLRLDLDDEPAYSTKQWRGLEQDCDNLQVANNELIREIGLNKQTISNLYGEISGLQAQVGVMRETMLEAVSRCCYFTGHGCLSKDYREPKCSKRLICQALSTTPAEAGERVRNVADALDSCLQFVDELKDHGIYNWSGEQAARDALAKYRGGADKP